MVPDLFLHPMNKIAEEITEEGYSAAQVGLEQFTNLGYVDDVPFLQ